MTRSPRSGSPKTATPLAVKVVGRTAGVLALLGVATFVVILVLLIASGAGGGRDVSGTPLGSFTLNVLVPVLAGSLILSLLLALLNSIGVRPWFDPATGRFVRPRSPAAWAVALGGLLAGILIPVTLITVVVAAIVVTSLDPGSDAIDGVITGIVIGGIGAAVTVAAIAGGVAVMGWFGVVAGLMLGAGFVGVVIAGTGGSPLAWVLGLLGLALAVASYVAGGRLHGTIPRSAGGLAASGAYLALGLGFFLYALVERDPIAIVGGLAGVAATVGWVIGGRTVRGRPAGRAA
jgi:hypothetical protein